MVGDKAIAIIPARGGSKRIPRKNIKPFCGQPIICYSIKAALESGCFKEVMVSTDDEEIAAVAQKMGAQVPFMRSKKNSDDYSSTADVLEEVILEYRKRAREFDFFCCLYPGAPFVTKQRLLQACDLFKSSGAESVFPIVRYSYPIWRSLKVENGLVSLNWPENYEKRTQDLAPAFHDAGQFYIMRTESLLKEKRLYTKHSIGIEISELESQDIDNESDWNLAEIKFQLLGKNN